MGKGSPEPKGLCQQKPLLADFSGAILEANRAQESHGFDALSANRSDSAFNRLQVQLLLHFGGPVENDGQRGRIEFGHFCVDEESLAVAAHIIGNKVTPRLRLTESLIPIL